jgi:hypothetical protein
VESNFKIKYRMKKVVNAGIGGRSFVVDEDAYERLDTYLSHYRSKLPGTENEAMDDLEMRIADLFEEEIKSPSQVVTLALVERVIGQLGMPDGSQETEGSSYSFSDRKGDRPVRKFPVRLYKRDIVPEVIIVELFRILVEEGTAVFEERSDIGTVGFDGVIRKVTERQHFFETF